MTTIKVPYKLDKLRAILRKLDNPPTLRVGFLENAKYPDGTSVAMVAAIQDYGAPAMKIPPRPFFRNMIRDELPGWPAVVKAALVRTNLDIPKAFDAIGQVIKGQLQQSIADYNAGPPLSPVTIARKGFDKQLIETAHMMNSADYEVKGD